MYLMLSATLFIVACEPDSTPVVDTSNSVLTLTSESVLNYGAEGGHALITYTLENGVEGVKVEAKPSVDWLTDFYITDGQIAFYVEASTVEEPREGTVHVTYGTHSFIVGVRQAAYIPNEVTLNNCVLNGSFNGRDTTANTVFNYTICLSDNGMTGPNDSQTSSYSYHINLYSEKLHGFVVDRLPNGEFQYDVRGRGTINSFVPDGSYYTIYGGEEPVSYKITDGSITITDDGITATFYTEDERVHNINYSGSKELTYLNAEEPAPYSTLEEDLNFELDMAYIRCHFYGDGYGLGYDNWSISIIEDHSSFSGMYFLFNILVDPSKGYTEGAYLGEYKAYNIEMGDNYTNTFVPGTWRGFASYSWFVMCDMGYIMFDQGSAPMVDGVIRFTENEDGVCIEFDCVDDNNHKIKGKIRNRSIGEIVDVRDPKHPQYGF